MEFNRFLKDEEEANKKRKKIAETIKKAVNKKLIEYIEYNDSSLIKFKADDPTFVRETVYEVVVATDYLKKYAKDMQRAIYITTTRSSETQQESDSMVIEIHRLSKPEFLTLLSSLKEKYTKLIEN